MAKLGVSLSRKQSEKVKSEKMDFYVVGIGASAGGLEALQAFFDHCVDDIGMAFVIVQHLSPDYKSLMPELLSRHTTMPVNEAIHGETVKPNHIYIIPGKKNIIIDNGILQLINRPRTSEVNFSIDIFFHSLAEYKKDHAIGVILSGTGSDGSRGGKSIKEIGGTMFVQDPDTCKFDGMPHSAISHGLADFILAPEEIPEELTLFIKNFNYGEFFTGTDLGKKKEYIYRILKLIKNQTQFDFYNYKTPTLLRRTAKRMNICKVRSVEEYIEYLYSNPEEKFILSNEFLIGVTKFFRDAKAFEEIEKTVIPSLLKEVVQGQLIKVWIVACSTGEEAYSTAILLEEARSRSKVNWNYRVFATDIDAEAIETANKGIYSQNIILDLTTDRLNRYFVYNNGQYQIDRSIRKNIVFSKHDILQNPPFNKMDLICCRNMLIYIESSAQHKILSSLHFALKLNGFLMLGPSENLSKLSSKFEVISKKWKIYTNVNPTRLIDIQNNSEWLINKSSNSNRFPKSLTTSKEEKILTTVNRQIMEDYNAATICINEQMDITYAVGRLKEYIEIPDEGYSNNLTRILPDHILVPITTGIRKIKAGDNDVSVTKSIKIVREEELIHLKIIIRALDPNSKYHQFFTITFHKGEQRSLSDSEKKVILPEIETNKEEIFELKEALLETQQNLQATIEELETSNEEMQATNEELLAANEELQSTNEELQSLNEELHTVNAELQEKNSELLELNSDMENLMKSTNIGTIFLDKYCNIRKFTPAVRTHFKLREEDLGRSITHFSGNIGIDNTTLVREVNEVLNGEEAIRREFQTTEGIWYFLQILPYRTQQEEIQGAVINFVDIDLLKTTIKESEKKEQYLDSIYDNFPVGIVLLDNDAGVIASSQGISNILGYQEEELLGVSLLNFTHPDDKEAGEKLLNDIKTKGLSHYAFDKRYITKKKKYIWAHVKVKVMHDENGDFKHIIAVISNITKRKQNEIELHRINEELERFAYLASHDLKEPLRSIHSFANRFIDKYKSKVDQKGQKYLDFIVSSTLQMQKLTDELLTYSKLGNKELNFRNINLNDTLKKVIIHLSQSIEESNATITFKDLPNIIGDPTQIELLFQNLISNALKYRSDEAPMILIRAKELERHWEFSIQDNGIGILPEYHDKIFEVFRRLHNKNEYQGTGIGLANCKRIVLNHHGKIRVESTGKGGSTFIFTIYKSR